MVSPPTPTKANCPSDSCPDQPVRIVSESATIAHNKISVHVNNPLLVVTTSGNNNKRPNKTANPMWLRLRTHQIPRRRSGTGRTRGANDQPDSSRCERANHRTTIKTARNMNRSTMVWLVLATLSRMIFSTTPTATPAINTPGSDRIRASSETISTRNSKTSARA